MASTTDQKLEDITNAVLEELTGSCAECGITNDIDRQSFVCYSESPTHVTYRARLEGTSETDSGSLISLIEDWVGSETGIIVTGVLMTVDSECSVAISSLTEGECSGSTTSSSQSSTDNTAAIIGGGVVAAFLIIAITVMVVALILKYRRGNLSIKKAKG